jgi:hypothetical protein
MTSNTEILAADLNGLQLIVKGLLNRLTAVETKLEVLESLFSEITAG